MNKAVIKAWKLALNSRSNIHDQINNMSRDIKGMVYLDIKAKNDFNDYVNSESWNDRNGSKMRLGDQLARITSQSQLLINDQENWKAA